jgi:hypothetical protein
MERPGGRRARAGGGGGAVGPPTTGGSPQEESKAVVEDAAKQLGVTPSRLSSALKQALENRVDAAVADGRLTKEQGDALKARIEAEDYPMLGGFGFGHHGGPGIRGFGHLDAAAAYLGMTETELATELAGGKTLADVAKAKAKSVDGLVSALVADEKQELDAAVAAGRITRAQADEMLANAKQRFTDMASGTLPDRGHGPFGAPPGALWSGSQPDGPTI